MYPIWIKQNLNEFRPRVSKTSHICTARTRMLSSITNQNQNDNYASWMLLIYFPHDHGFRERMTISTIIRRMIIAMQVHFRVFFCSFFAFWRRFVPVSICSAAPVTCVSMLSSISPWASTKTPKSRKIWCRSWSFFSISFTASCRSWISCSVSSTCKSVKFRQDNPALSASRLQFLQLHWPKELVPFLALAPELLSERSARRCLFLSAYR